MQSLVLLSAARSDADPAVQAWARFRNEISAVHPVASARVSDAVVLSPSTAPRTAAAFWRVLATNNRELARSYFLYPSFAAAAGHVQRLILAADELAIVPLGGTTGREHGWYATMGDTPVLSCSRWYGGRSTALQAGIGAIRSLATARIVESMHLIGSHRSNPRVPVGSQPVVA